MVNIEFKIEGLDKLIKQFGEDNKRIQRATQRALKDTAKKVKTATAQVMVRTYALPSARIKQDIHIKWPSYTTPAIVTFSGKSPGLQHYKPRQVIGGVQSFISPKSKGSGLAQKKVRGKNKGVSVEVQKGKRRQVKGGFLITVKTAPGVWRREGKERLPIERLYGPSIMGMFNATGGLELTRQVIWENMDKAFTREWEKELRRG